jgi:hypothetical protein
MREKNWDKYEVALLIEAFLAIEDGADKILTLENLSSKLREMARIDGFDVDDRFRNLNGMQWQLGYIKLILKGAELKNRKAPKIFLEGVQIYKEHRDIYLELLREAYEKIGQGTKEMTAEERKQNFIKWLEAFNGKKCSVESFVDNFEKVSSYAKKYNIAKSKFWEISEVKRFNVIRNNLSGNRIFKFTHPRLFSFMEKFGKLYSTYLKETIQETPISNIKHDESKNSVVDDAVYVVHDKFGLGVVVSENGDILNIRFDNIDSIKNMMRGHSSIHIITKEEYEKRKKALEISVETKAEEKHDKTHAYHIKFGFGVIKEHNQTSVDILFDEQNEIKTMAKEHPSICFISKEEYDSKIIPEGYVVKKENPIKTIESLGNKPINNDSNLIVDFNKTGDYSFTVPNTVKYFDDIEHVKSWKDAYNAALKCLYDDYANIFNRYIGKSLIGANRIDIGTKSEIMVAPRSIGGGLFIETNLSATDIIKRVKIILDLCCVDYENLVIKYNKNRQSQDDRVYVVVEQKSQDDGGAFSDWLYNVQHMSSSSSRNYYASLKTADEFALKHNRWNKSIFSLIEKEEMIKAVNSLLNDELFALYNTEQHNRFSAALKKYVAFKCGEEALTLITFGRGSRSPKVSQNVQEKSIYAEGILALLEGHYKYGFRINSPIEIMRIRNYASNEGISLPEDDESLKSEIRNVGFTMDDKVYVFGEEIVNELEERINSIFEKGYNLIFFDAYMDKDSEWLSENHILTVELLKELLARTKLELFYGKNFISGRGKVTEIGGIVEEIKRIWGESVLITNNEMEEMLPYIPDDRIRHALSASEEMVWVSHETYTCLEKVIINSDDAEKIISYVDEACDKKGFASISDAPLKNVIEENFELSMTAIYEAVFNKVLKDKFFLNGKIITKTSSGLDAVTLVKVYCEDKEECSFEELYNKVIDLTGASNRQIAFEAGYGVMVRVGENRFVADKYVSFDVSYIDSLLEEIIVEGFTSIKDITTFARFSICGQEWNHYLLESYCYRFSKKFTLNVINFNDKNAGIISKKTLGLSYKEMLAKTIVKAKIELTDNIALQYLYDNGYLAKRQYGAIGEVLKIAESLK